MFCEIPPLGFNNGKRPYSSFNHIFIFYFVFPMFRIIYCLYGYRTDSDFAASICLFLLLYMQNNFKLEAWTHALLLKLVFFTTFDHHVKHLGVLYREFEAIKMYVILGQYSSLQELKYCKCGRYMSKTRTNHLHVAGNLFANISVKSIYFCL